MTQNQMPEPPLCLTLSVLPPAEALTWGGMCEHYLFIDVGYTNGNSSESCDTLLAAWCVGHSGRKAGASHFSCHMIHQRKGHVHAKTFPPLAVESEERDWEDEEDVKNLFPPHSLPAVGPEGELQFQSPRPTQAGQEPVGRTAITCCSSLIRLTSDAGWVTRQLIK